MEALGAIPLTDASEILFYIDSYKGKDYANIRKFVKSKRYTGPTKSGVKLNKEQLETLYEALLEYLKNEDNIQEQELLVIPINSGSYFSVRVSNFKEDYGLDIRQYFSTKKYEGPTKKGVRIPLKHLRDTSDYCQNMVATLEALEAKQVLFLSSQETPKKQKPKKRDKQIVKGVPDEFQEYFE